MLRARSCHAETGSLEANTRLFSVHYTLRMIHKDSEALRGFFDTNRSRDEPNTSVTGYRARRTSVAMIVIGVYAKVAFAALIHRRMRRAV